MSRPPAAATRTPRPWAHRNRVVGVLVVAVLVAAGMPAAAAPAGEVGPRDVPRPAVDRAAAAVTGGYERLRDTPGAIPGEVLVTYADDVAQQVGTSASWQSVAAAGADDLRPLADRVALVTADEAAVDGVVAALADDPDVVAVEPNIRREFLAAPDDTSYDLQWAHAQTRAEGAWDVATGRGATAPLIAILDSGVDATHPDLDGVVVSSLRSVDGRVIPGAPSNDPCGIGHGTAVAGSAAARGDNDFGVAGVLWEARVIDIALTSPENGCPGGPSDDDTITAMAHVTRLAEPPLAMNLSLGASLTACSQAYQAAADQARAAGIAVVAAAGNDGTSRTSVPASCDGVISVAATTADGTRASYSQTNPQVDLAAPGGDLRGPITSCPTFEQLVAQMVVTTSDRDAVSVIGGCPDYVDPSGHRLRGISGTSFASPYVAAAIALIRQVAADRGQPLSPDQAEAIIEATAQDVGAPGRDCDLGWGILDLDAAVDATVAGERPPLQPDAPIGTGGCGQPAASCSGALAADGGPIRRVADTGSATTPVCQAVAMSQVVLADGQSPFAVIARSDDFADALAGSALGLGIGPLLFTSSTGELDPRTEAELRRVLDFDDGRPSAFIMGGTAAIPAAVDSRLESLGINPVRIAGDGREATAAAAARAVRQLVADAPFETRDHAFVAYGRDFADAVAAGQMAAYYGIPVLLTNRDGLHPVTAEELARLAPERVWALGGDAVIADQVIDDIDDLGFSVERLAGDTRIGTAMAIRDAYLDEMAVDGVDSGGVVNVAVNVRHNFNDVLSASLLGGHGAVFVPLEDPGPTSPVRDEVREGVCGAGGNLFVVGGRDRISDATADEVYAITQGQRC
ncbi:S8 family serine peptidase [Euzebya sp.]|uniref:S8 family serine peptidase n=1 Tax=Euzebya sp. TaxID=1971409 RepID=UPI00351757B1